MTEAETVLLLVALLREEKPFVHVRFGDGDVFFASKTGPRITGDGEEWTAELALNLNGAWIHLSECPDRLLLGDLFTYSVSDGCEVEWSAMLEIQEAVRPQWKPRVSFVHMEALRVGFGYALPFYEEIRDSPRRKFFVAPTRLAPVGLKLGCGHIPIPLHVAHECAQETVEIIKRLEPDVVLFAAGRGGKIMQGELACSMPDLTQIDVGSGLDLLIEDGVRRGTDLGVNREDVLHEYRTAGLA